MTDQPTEPEPTPEPDTEPEPTPEPDAEPHHAGAEAPDGEGDEAE
jgi:hypothetical protein